MSIKFRCIYCGKYFSLSKEEEQDRQEGYFDHDPDTCDDCMGNQSNFHEETSSDADPGL